VSVWVLWNERNHRLFNNMKKKHFLNYWTKSKLLFWLLKTTNVTLVANFHSWWSNPMLCLGID
jgi:hypothetical protein